MIPKTAQGAERQEKMASRTYQLDQEAEHILGYVDGKEALEQAVEKVLKTPRYAYEIYDWSYGSELDQLMGRPLLEAERKAEQYIKEALLWDERIKEIKNIQWEKEKESLWIYFHVVTEEGVIEIKQEVRASGI